MILSPHAYSDTIHNEKIAILGPYPPPYGGIAIHIKRVGEKFISQQNTVYFFDTMQRSKFFLVYLFHLIKFLFMHKTSRIYFHTLYAEKGVIDFIILIFFKYMFGRKIIHVDHDPGHFKKKNWLTKKIISISLKYVDQQIIIGSTTFESYVRDKITIRNDLRIESPYLPPNENDENAIIATYPESVFLFLNNHFPIITANAFHLIKVQNGDLYGLDWSIELIYLLKKKFPDIGLLFSLVQIGDADYYRNQQQIILELGLQNNFFIFLGQKEFWPLLRRSDLFIRPTKSDSFGISISEALNFNVPVVASDVCVRQVGAVLYDHKNKIDFFKKSQSVLLKKYGDSISHERTDAYTKL